MSSPASIWTGTARPRTQPASACCAAAIRYPRRLGELPNAPAVLHVAGELDRFLGLSAADPVAVVGARRCSPYGREAGSALGRGLATAGLTSSAAWRSGSTARRTRRTGRRPGDDRGAADRRRSPVPAERAPPVRADRLHRGRGLRAAAWNAAWRWTFTARNRIIAGLSAMTVVVEAANRSGALTTARVARGLGRPVGAVPVASPRRCRPAPTGCSPRRRHARHRGAGGARRSCSGPARGRLRPRVSLRRCRRTSRCSGS